MDSNYKDRFIKDWVRISEAAKAFNVSETTIRRYIDEGYLEVMEKDKSKLRLFRMVRSKRPKD